MVVRRSAGDPTEKLAAVAWACFDKRLPSSAADTYLTCDCTMHDPEGRNSQQVYVLCRGDAVHVPRALSAGFPLAATQLNKMPRAAWRGICKVRLGATPGKIAPFPLPGSRNNYGKSRPPFANHMLGFLRIGERAEGHLPFDEVQSEERGATVLSPASPSIWYQEGTYSAQLRAEGPSLHHGPVIFPIDQHDVAGTVISNLQRDGFPPTSTVHPYPSRGSRTL